MDLRLLPGSSVHGILQARILDWLPRFPLGISPTQGSNSCLLDCRQILYCWTTRKPVHGTCWFSEQPFLLQRFFLVLPPLLLYTSVFSVLLLPFPIATSVLFLVLSPFTRLLDFFLLAFPLFVCCPNTEQEDTNSVSNNQLLDWKGLCWVMQTVLKFLLSEVLRNSANASFFPAASRKSSWELVTQQKPDGSWEGPVQDGRLS